MRIKEVIIRNFRSIKELRIECRPFTILIGKNNHGKSNILYALEFFFDTSWTVDKNDFFVHAGANASIEVEVVFSELSEQDRHTFKDYIRADNTIVVKKRAYRID